jgi:hypothetical protein
MEVIMILANHLIVLLWGGGENVGGLEGEKKWCISGNKGQGGGR